VFSRVCPELHRFGSPFHGIVRCALARLLTP
jgi:hypothetical protein